MKSRNHRIVLIGLVMTAFAFAQQDLILPMQITAIKSLAIKQGFNTADINAYVVQMQGDTLERLTRQQGATLILAFQSDNPPSPQDIIRALPTPPSPQPPAPDPPMAAQSEELLLAQNLEVGMSKRFHLIDGNVIEGTIIGIDDDMCQIETIDGLLRVPSQAILEETVHITKKNDTRYSGPVLRETQEEIVLRSDYGDVVVSKRDVREMDRYHGGKRVPWAEEKKKFYRSEAALTEIFANPTAFPSAANTFYIDGYNVGYGFTDRLMIQTSFADNFTDDLNLNPTLQVYHRQTGTSEVAAAVGFHVFSRHPVTAVVAPYGQFLINTARDLSIDLTGETLEEVLLDPDARIFFGKVYMVLSSRRSLASGRGRLGWHIGLMTNTLIGGDLPALRDTTYTWNEEWLFGTRLPFRAWGAFEYDLSKRMKVMITMWADNGYKYNTVSETLNDYWKDTPGRLDSAEGEYRMVDFDFGLLYAFSETFRLGFHFQKPYFIIYWEIFQL